MTVLNNIFDVRGSVHRSTVHKDKSNKMQQCIKILLFHIYMTLKLQTTFHVCKPEAENTVRAPDDEGYAARNMLSLQ